jgi:FdhD protein
VDKVIGWALREGRLPLRGTILLVSGRASFELVQKAVMAGIPMLGAVSAPSSLAVDLAKESNMALVGFLRDPSMVVYAGAERVGEALDKVSQSEHQ